MAGPATSLRTPAAAIATLTTPLLQWANDAVADRAAEEGP
jgi:hypothetical protein